MQLRCFRTGRPPGGREWRVWIQNCPGKLAWEFSRRISSVMPPAYPPRPSDLHDANSLRELVRYVNRWLSPAHFRCLWGKIKTVNAANKKTSLPCRGVFLNLFHFRVGLDWNRLGSRARFEGWMTFWTKESITMLISTSVRRIQLFQPEKSRILLNLSSTTFFVPLPLSGLVELFVLFRCHCQDADGPSNRRPWFAWLSLGTMFLF